MRALPGVLLSVTLLSAAAGPATGAAVVPVDRLRVTVEPLAETPGIRARIGALFRDVRLRSIGPFVPKPGTRYRVTATAYSSTVAQTDLTPCITAAGTRVREGIVATNFLPLGTQLRIGNALFVVEDRMNERYNGKYIIDVWRPTTGLAREFGAQTIEIEIVGWIELVPEGRRRPGPRRAERAPLARVIDFLFGRAFTPEEEDC